MTPRPFIPMWPDWIPGWDTSPALFRSNRPWIAAPDTVVIHSGKTAPGVAEYLHGNPEALARKVSAHFAWSRELAWPVQCESLHFEAWAQGKVWNRRAISIELPGPVHKERGEDEYSALNELLEWLETEISSLTTICGHNEICATREDPGRGFDWAQVITDLKRIGVG